MERTGKHGRKTETTIRKTVNAISMGFSVLRACSAAWWLTELAVNGDTVSTAHTVLTVVVNLGKILTGLHN